MWRRGSGSAVFPRSQGSQSFVIQFPEVDTILGQSRVDRGKSFGTLGGQPPETFDQVSTGGQCLKLPSSELQSVSVGQGR